MGREMAKGMAGPGEMLLGRRTWQDFIIAWGRRTDGNPFTARMNATTKYVASTTLENADAWENSVLLRGDAAASVASLKAEPGGDLGIIGSASLARSLHAAGLIDRYTLLICPLTMGRGTRLFEGPAPLTEFELTSSVTTTKGVIIAQYARRQPGPGPSGA
jgi:dihydrofolate reductase